MPEIFGWEHLIYMAVSFTLMISALIFINKKVHGEKELVMIIRGTGLLLLACVVWNRFAICILRDGLNRLLPNTYCSFASFTFSFSVLFCKKDSRIFHFVLYLGLLGGISSMLCPNYLGQADSIFYPMTISSLMHHTVMVFLALLMLTTGYFRPALKRWYCLPVGLFFTFLYGLFLILVLGYNDAMAINFPLVEGTFLTWYLVGPLFIGVHGLVLYVYERMLTPYPTDSELSV